MNDSTSVESGQITELIKIGNLHKAKSLVKAVLVKEPYNLEAMLLLSEIAEKQYCRLEAIHILRKILMNNPSNHKAAKKLREITTPNEISWINDYLRHTINQEEIV